MEEETSTSRKRKVRLIAGVFLGILILLTMAGNTLQALTLPKVLLSLSSKGELAHSYTGSATVNPTVERELPNPAGWKVTQVLVTKGDTVHKGQTLITYDDKEAQQRLDDEQVNLKKQTLQLDQLKYNLLQALKNEDEAAKLNATSTFETAKLDISTQQKHIQILQENISQSRQLTAPFDGIITEVGTVEGLQSSDIPDVRLSNTANGYQIQLLIPEDIASLLSLGEVVDDIVITGEDAQTITGKVTKIDEAGGNSNTLGESGSTSYSLTISFKDNRLHGGERVQVKITKSRTSEQILIPNTAIHKDNSGTYIYTISSKQGPLGNSYYVNRTPIKVSDSNEYISAVSEGLFDQQEVIIDSTGFIMDGIRVRR